MPELTNAEKKEIVMKFVNDFKNALTTFKGLTPCIITHSEDDTKLMKNAYKAADQMISFIDGCEEDLGYLSEEFDIDKIISEYPKVDSLFKSTDPEGGIPFD